jgi:hypothetical protein
MKLVLLDIDGVLAIGPDGKDCGARQEIHRTSRDPLIPPPPSDTRVVLLTHRQRTEAEQIVSALDLRTKVHGIVCADDMMAEWFRQLLRGRLMPGLTKDLCAPLLGRRFAWSADQATAFIDDSLFNLERMRAAGIARHCIHIPRPHVDDGRVRSVAVGEAVRAAYRLLDGDAQPPAPGDAIVRMEWATEPTDLAQLATGVLLDVRVTPAARLRASLAAIRRWAARAPMPGRTPPSQG